MSFFLKNSFVCTLEKKEILSTYTERKRYMNLAAGERAKKTKTKSEKNDHHCFRRRLYRHHPLLEYARGRKKRLGDAHFHHFHHSLLEKKLDEFFCNRTRH